MWCSVYKWIVYFANWRYRNVFVFYPISLFFYVFVASSEYTVYLCASYRNKKVNRFTKKYNYCNYSLCKDKGICAVQRNGDFSVLYSLSVPNIFLFFLSKCRATHSLHNINKRAREKLHNAFRSRLRKSSRCLFLRIRWPGESQRL